MGKFRKDDFVGWLLLPVGIFAGWLAGTAMSRRIVREEVARLESLIEGRNRKPAPELPKAETETAVEEVSRETILLLSAAVAAYLGKRAQIRSARLVRTAPSSAWAQQGRVFIQASHNLGVVHGR